MIGSGDSLKFLITILQTRIIRQNHTKKYHVKIRIRQQPAALLARNL